MAEAAAVEAEKSLTLKEAAAVGFFTAALTDFATAVYATATHMVVHPIQYVVLGIIGFVAGLVGSLMSHALFKEGHKAHRVVVSY